MRFNRVPRDPATFPIAGEIEVRRPPALPSAAPAQLMTRVMPVFMLAAMAAMMVVYFRSGNVGARSPMFLLFPVMMAVSVLGSVLIGSRGNRRHAEVDADRRDYLRYLAAMSDCIETAAADQYDRAHRTHPPPDSLWHLIGTERMWQRGSADPDFTEVRLGVGTAVLHNRVVSPAPNPDEPHDPVTLDALDRLLHSRTEVSGVPVTINLNEYRHITVRGCGAAAMVRSVLCQLAVWHGPDGIRILTLTVGRDWDWLKWLPHHYRSGRVGDGPLRYTDAEQLLRACDAMSGCHLVVVTDRPVGAVPPRRDITVLQLSATQAGPRLDVSDDAVVGSGIRGLPDELNPDAITIAQALSCARLMTRFELANGQSSTGPDWPSLVGCDDPTAVRPDHAWPGRDGSAFLRVPIGVGGDGAPVYLDLKESAQAGMGPHGLCIGATGSGKSEFLRTLALGLVSTHSPAELNLVLIDFKGGATFLGFEPLRHVAAVITNLAQEAHLVARMRDALAGELTRRQELLRAAGNLADIGEYRRARAAGAVLSPLPALLIVVDEFSELLSRHPDFAELFVAIGRLGRSLGIHLLLASQRLEEGRLRGLDSHLSYRICLKTFSANESRAVIGVPDAHELPGMPGSGYLKTADGELVRFRAAFVSAPVPGAVDTEPRLFTGEAHRRADDRATVLQVVTERLSGHGPAAHQVWLPPLPHSPALSDLLVNGGGDNGPSLCVPIGLVDNPFEQQREVLAVDLRGPGGHLAIVGGPRSGKSTTLQTVLLALAATHCAGRLNIYGVDLGDGALVALRTLPHVGAVAGRDDPELVQRIIAQLSALIHRRQSGTPRADDAFGEVVLAVDGWPALRRDFDDLEDKVTSIATQGLSVGVHVVLTSSRWAELRPALKDQIGSRIELQLGDPTESEMDRRRAPLLAGRPPGRGITRDGLEFAVALPQAQPMVSAERAPRIEALPRQLSLAALTAADGRDFVIGLADDDRPFVLDLAAEPLLIILGDNECGKTATLRTLCRAVMASVLPARLLVIDYRRTLLGVVDSAHLAGYAMSAATADAELAAVIAGLTARLPGPGVTQQQLRNRSWWSGPELFVIVDDYDLVAGAGGNPLLALLELLPHARDIGLHLVIARRSGGAARAMFDPVLARMRDLGATGLLMSAAPDEGALMGGVRSAPLPPGRVVIVQRGQPHSAVQIGWSEPP